ncbi:MAG: 2-hydroxyacid dehydrogenase, partial [Hespellia sp.]|nr:2-hydroxyacid dehydrogenase [Hespellia sp.]
MKRISFYDAKSYDKEFFDKENEKYGYEIEYHEEKLNSKTAVFAQDSDAVCAFVNDNLNQKTIKKLVDAGIGLIAMRCAGYNNVDFKEAYGKIHVLRVPAYSPYAVAEHAVGLLMTLNRKLHKAYNRTREFNFSLSGLTGFDLHGKTVGVIGTGKIGRCFINICKGFGMRVIAFDPYPAKDVDFEYVALEELLAQSDVISLHCPLSKDNYHIIDQAAIEQMKEGVVILNTSRGALIDSEALLQGLLCGKVGAAGLDVYEEEADMFYEDNSNQIILDEVLSRFVSLPNVLITSHQAFLTKEALENIAE